MFWLGFCALNLETTTSMHGMPVLPQKMPVPNYKSWELLQALKSSVENYGNVEYGSEKVPSSHD